MAGNNKALVNTVETTRQAIHDNETQVKSMKRHRHQETNQSKWNREARKRTNHMINQEIQRGPISQQPFSKKWQGKQRCY